MGAAAPTPALPARPAEHLPRNHLLVVVSVGAEGHARRHHIGDERHVVLDLLARAPALRLRLGVRLAWMAALRARLGQQRHGRPLRLRRRGGWLFGGGGGGAAALGAALRWAGVALHQQTTAGVPWVAVFNWVW